LDGGVTHQTWSRGRPPGTPFVEPRVGSGGGRMPFRVPPRFGKPSLAAPQVRGHHDGSGKLINSSLKILVAGERPSPPHRPSSSSPGAVPDAGADHERPHNRLHPNRRQNPPRAGQRAPKPPAGWDGGRFRGSSPPTAATSTRGGGGPPPEPDPPPGNRAVLLPGEWETGSFSDGKPPPDHASSCASVADAAVRRS